MELRVRQGFGLVAAEQVSTPGGAVQHGPAGEYTVHRAGGVLQHVADVVMGVARGVQDAELDGPGVDGVSVGDGVSLVVDVVAGGHDVHRAGRAGQFQAAGEVIVVDVGFEYVGNLHAVVGDEVEYPVDVALRVDHHRGVTVGDQVAAVSETGGFDDGHVHEMNSLFELGVGCHVGVVPQCRSRVSTRT